MYAAKETTSARCFNHSLSDSIIMVSAENGINPKTYYYRLRKSRENCIESTPAIVPMPIQHQSSEIRIEKNGLQITLPIDTSSEILINLIRELC